MNQSKERPNILVLMSDQHSKNFLSCYGNPVVRTPNLDRLAAKGTRFTSTYCPAPLCVPSRMSFMTTRMPSQNQVWNNNHVLASGIPTWAHALGAAGYETSLIGRMHFVGPDQRHGFENRPIGEYSANHPGVPERGGPRWQKFPASTSGQSRVSVEIAGKGTTTYQWFDEQVAATACEYLREHRNASRPFAAVAGFVLPHCPFIAPKDLFEYYYEKVDIPAVEPAQPETIQRFRRQRGILKPLPAERVRVARAAYYALCEYFDSLVGQVLDCLAESGLAENTLVVYCSDHGEMAGEHGCWWKSNYYEHSVGVPLIMRYPGKIPAGKIVDNVCNLMDLGATFIETAGAEPLLYSNGRSLWPLLRSDAGEWENVTFSELVDVRDGKAYPSRMIRSGDWKLWEFADAENLPSALFNLADDPNELTDLGQNAAFASIREHLREKLHANWNPAFAEQKTWEGNAGTKTLADWGRVVLPQSEDALAAPPPELEDDVELR